MTNTTRQKYQCLCLENSPKLPVDPREMLSMEDGGPNKLAHPSTPVLLVLPT